MKVRPDLDSKNQTAWSKWFCNGRNMTRERSLNARLVCRWCISSLCQFQRRFLGPGRRTSSCAQNGNTGCSDSHTPLTTPSPSSSSDNGRYYICHWTHLINHPINRGVSTMGLQFGSFNGICETAALVICPLIGTAQGVVPTCYSRNVDIGKTLIFQPCKSAPQPFY